jgi:hypothetical protein
MVTYSFDLAMWTVLFFIVGMYRPQWPLFFLKKPDRFMIVVITTIFVMATFTLYGEGMRREKLAKEATTVVAPKSTNTDSTPVPVPVPSPDKPEPAKKFL